MAEWNRTVMLRAGVEQFLLVMHAALVSRAMMLKLTRINCLDEMLVDKTLW